MVYLEPASDDDPCLRVGIFDDAVPAGVAFATVRRSVGGASETDVRDAIKIPVSGALSRFDYEAPMDADLTYRAQWFDEGGVDAGFSEPATTRVVGPWFADGRPRVLLHNPLDPRTAVWVHPGAGWASALSRPTPGEVRWSHGARLGMVQSGRRRGLTEVQLDVVTDTREDAERVDALFGTETSPRLPVLCVRIPESLRLTRLPPVWFAAVLERTALRDPVGTDEVVWRMSADQVEAPVPTLVIPSLSRADIAAYYASRQAVADANPTRLSVSRRFDLAGSGGA